MLLENMLNFCVNTAVASTVPVSGSEWRPSWSELLTHAEPPGKTTDSPTHYFRFKKPILIIMIMKAVSFLIKIFTDFELNSRWANNSHSSKILWRDECEITKWFQNIKMSLILQDIDG